MKYRDLVFVVAFTALATWSWRTYTLMDAYRTVFRDCAAKLHGPDWNKPK